MGLLLIGLAVFFRSKITNRIKNTEERGGTNDLNDNKSNIIINNNNNTNNNSKYKRKQAQTDEFRMIPDDYFNDVTSDDEFSWSVRSNNNNSNNNINNIIIIIFKCKICCS